jgi:hypothetical protein
MEELVGKIKVDFETLEKMQICKQKRETKQQVLVLVKAHLHLRNY